MGAAALAAAISDAREQRDEKDIVFKGIKISTEDRVTLSEDLFKFLPALTHIEINECRLKALGPELALFKGTLEVLRVPNNLLEKLPAEAGRLSKLSEIDLSFNQFQKFPLNELATLSNLTHIDLKHNRLATLPPISGKASASSDGIPGSLANLAHLTHLDLSSNQFTELPMGLCDIPMLKSLDLSANQLKVIPPDFARWMGTKLTSFSLSRNLISVLPDEIGALKSLVSLDLSENDLHELPQRIGNLIHLQHLSLQHNHIKSLPPSIGHLVALISFKLHDNELEDLPVEIGHLTALNELYLQENKLKRLSPAIGRCSSLRKLFAEYNEISELPPELTELKRLIVLILHHNKLEDVPLVLASLTSLLRLSLDDNPIKDPAVKQIIASEGSLALFKRVNQTEIPLGSMRTMRGLRREAMDDSRLLRSSPEQSQNPANQPSSKFLSRTISFSNSRKLSDSEPNVSALSQSRNRSATTSEPPPGLGLSGGSISSALVGSASPSTSSAEKAPEYAKFKGAFNSLLEEQDFSSKKKEMLKKMSTNDKWNLLTQYKGSTLELLRGSGNKPGTSKDKPKSGSAIGPRSTRTPQDYVNLIKQRRASRMELATLKKLLSIQSQTWILQFIDAGGIAACILFLNYLPTKFVKSATDTGCIAELLGILKIFSELCLKQLLTTNQSVVSIVLNLFCSTNDEITSLCLDLLDSFCSSVHEIGPSMTAEALEKVFKARSPTAPIKQKFTKLLQCMVASSLDLEHRFMSFGVIFYVIDSFDDLVERFDARLQVSAEGLNAQLKLLQAEKLSQLQKMFIDRYEEEYSADYADMVETYAKDIVLEHFRSAGINPGEDVGDDLASVELSVAGFYSKRLLVKNVNGTTVSDMMAEIASKINIPASSLDDYGLFADSTRLEPTKLISEFGASVLLSLEFRPRVWRVYVDLPVDVCKREISKKDRRLKFDPSLSAGEIVSLICKKLSIEHDRPLSLYHPLEHSASSSSTRDSEGSISESSSSTSVASEFERPAEGGLWLDDVKPLFTYGPSLFRRKGARTYKFLLKISRIPINIRMKDGQVHKLLLDPMLPVSLILKQLGEKLLPIGSNVGMYGLCADDAVAPVPSSSSSESAPAPLTWLDHSQLLGHYPFSTLKFAITPQPITVELPEQSEPKVYSVDTAMTISQIIQQICDAEGLDASKYTLSYVNQLSKGHPMMLISHSELSRQVDISRPMSMVLQPKTDDAALLDPSVATNIWDEKPEKDVNVTYNTNKPDEIETATLNILIAHLTSIRDVDEEFRRIFLLTYQFFTKPMILLQKLMERFVVPREQFTTDELYKSARELVQLRVLIFFKFWMQTHIKPETLQQIRATLNDWTPEDPGNLKRQFIALIKPPAHADTSGRAAPITPKPKIPKGITDHTQLSFHILDDHEVARQMTLSLFTHYAKIKPTDLTLGAWAKPSTFHLCANLMSVINDFNHVAGFIGTSILKETKVRQRAKLYAKFVDIAALLLEYKNFHLLTAILSGLNSASISRLKFTIARLPKHTMPLLARLEEIMSMQSSFKSYRALLAESMPPAIPYIGVYLTDLTFINDGNPDMLSNNRINFVKHRYVHNIIETIQKFQKDEFPFTAVPIIQKFLSTLEIKSETEQYELSLALEPRGAEKADIK